MGKMACCSKAIFRCKWGLSESGLMAVGVVPTLMEPLCQKCSLKTGGFSTVNSSAFSSLAGRARVSLPRLNRGVGRRKCRPCVGGGDTPLCPDKFMLRLNPTEKRQAKVREPCCRCKGSF
ncbi:hypothetical protein Q8A73_015817 [Channa argus]|nr:hypothetical protein Q8A73_015817 [Channa argus]